MKRFVAIALMLAASGAPGAGRAIGSVFDWVWGGGCDYETASVPFLVTERVYLCDLPWEPAHPLVTRSATADVGGALSASATVTAGAPVLMSESLTEAWGVVRRWFPGAHAVEIAVRYRLDAAATDAPGIEAGSVTAWLGAYAGGPEKGCSDGSSPQSAMIVSVLSANGSSVSLGEGLATGTVTCPASATFTTGRIDLNAFVQSVVRNAEPSPLSSTTSAQILSVSFSPS